jgi:hypothetical protein
MLRKCRYIWATTVRTVIVIKMGCKDVVGSKKLHMPCQDGTGRQCAERSNLLNDYRNMWAMELIQLSWHQAYILSYSTVGWMHDRVEDFYSYQATRPNNSLALSWLSSLYRSPSPTPLPARVPPTPSTSPILHPTKKLYKPAGRPFYTTCRPYTSRLRTLRMDHD